MPRVTANGLNIHVQQAGSGPDVVLIHGLTGDLSIWFLSHRFPRWPRPIGSPPTTCAGTATAMRPPRDTRRPTTPAT